VGTPENREGNVHEDFDIVCFSHLRWDFVYQRPQHLLSRCAQERRVLFIEEPVLIDGQSAWRVTPRGPNINVAVPDLSAADFDGNQDDVVAGMIDGLLAEQGISRYVLWYYTPMAVSLTRRLMPIASVFDCMDELSAFAGSSPITRLREAELLDSVDVVFAGGQSLYESKSRLHAEVHAFPSSVDVEHFSRAREPSEEPVDQVTIPRPRLGFFGVIDERLDQELIDGVAAARPDWQLVMLGPVLKIDPSELPKRPNIHYIGAKDYNDLPRYLAGWDVALLPFARNEATRFISPTKTPEYLAAGCPVVSTSIRDVVRPYGEMRLVHIADSVDGFVAAAEQAMRTDRTALQARIDLFLEGNSWDSTWAQMRAVIESKLGKDGTVLPEVGAVPHEITPTQLGELRRGCTPTGLFDPSARADA
jgi:UDP-galactopyranose mutase